MKSVGLARVRTFYIHDLDDPAGHALERTLAAGLEQNSVARIQKTLHQRDKFALLQHGFAAGDFHQSAAGT